jgi:serine-type D-Ala-D-Ala carboxypeptidase/endopeptidase (penicillin-binding protein 4)
VLHHPNAQQARGALDQLLEWTVRDQASPPKAQPSDRINHGSLRSSR